MLDQSGFHSGVPLLQPIGHLQGRTRHPVFELPGMGQVMWKSCLRGGFLSRFNRRTFFNYQRFERELIISDQLERTGVPAAKLIAFSVTRRGLGYHVDQLVRIEENVISLSDLLLMRGIAPSNAQVEIVGKLVFLFHQMGFLHGDLNMMNILVNENQDTSPRALLVDLDPGATSPGEDRISNLARLSRSYSKVISEGGCPLANGDRFRFIHHATGGNKELRKLAFKRCLDQLPNSEKRR